jgi:hypothetical protein
MRRLVITFVILFYIVSFASEAIGKNSSSVIKLDTSRATNIVPVESRYPVNSCVDLTIQGQNNHPRIWDNTVDSSTTHRKQTWKPRISVEYRISTGIYSGEDVKWCEADADKAEWNWRYTYGKDRYNTFDPRIYNRLKVNFEMNPSSNNDWKQ